MRMPTHGGNVFDLLLITLALCSVVWTVTGCFALWRVAETLSFFLFCRGIDPPMMVAPVDTNRPGKPIPFRAKDA